ncbi:MAG: GTP cyclohydrolase FolE2 [Planctomycetota bacterium]|nr:GTP cyclohydrolase FolE2 [Planctomycetota bacterium]
MATTTTEINLPDIQATPDQRATAIAAVGIRGLELPLQLDAGDGRLQTTLGTWDLAVGLAQGVRGTHMSRFVELASRFSAVDSLPVSRETLEDFSADLLDRLEAEDGRVRIKGRFLLRRSSPVTEIDLPVPFDFAWKLRARRVERKIQTKLVTEVGVLATSLCPCSREISTYGAHNQRARVRIGVTGPVSLSELVEVAESSASCTVFPLLKRPDEKAFTETAYERPRFVEDLVREVATGLRAIPGVGRFKIKAVNEESIHAHDAWAIVKGCGDDPTSQLA